MNINGYNEGQYRVAFVTSNWSVKLSRILGKFSTLNFDRCWDDARLLQLTPRETAIQSTFSVTSLYYLEFLLSKNPTLIIDIGCGGNIFKKIIPEIHGIDPTPGNMQADENDYFDEQYSVAHTDQFESVFAINSIHYVSLMEFNKRLLQFYNIVKPGGRGFVTFNMARMLELTAPHDMQTLFGTDSPLPQQLTEYIEDILQKTLINFLVVDLFINNMLNENMNGNIRLVFEK